MSDIQAVFLNVLKQHQFPVAVYLKNGVKLKGVITGFDEDSILMGKPIPQLVYKKNISTIAELVMFHEYEG